MRPFFLLYAILVCSTLFGAEPFVKKADIPYVPGSGKRQQLDLYLPINCEKAEKPLPVLCFIHGSGWSSGDKGYAAQWAHRFVPKGYAVVGITYRFVPHDPMPAQVVDCKTAVRWLRANAKEYNLDILHFGVLGHSAGGHLAAFLGVGGTQEFDLGENLDQSSVVQAAVILCGPSDFEGWFPGGHPARTGIYDVPIYRTVFDGMCKYYFGGTFEEKQDLIRKMGPLTHVSKDSAPMLIFHAVDDELVHVSQSRKLHSALEKVGAESELIEIPSGSGGHHARNFKTPETIEKITKFFEKHLK